MIRKLLLSVTFLVTHSVSGAGLTWPKGQALPWFSTPSATLDAVEIRSLRPDDQITVSALQGQVNKTKPRIFLVDHRAEEGVNTWPDSNTINLGPRKIQSATTLIKKDAAEVRGVVLYDPSKSSHYRNLAGTVAGIQRALPMTRDLYKRLSAGGIELQVLTDLTGVPFSTPLEIYENRSENYWRDCEKRIILSARPDSRGGDLHHTRDLASAVGCAVVWLDARIPVERELLCRFFEDMKAGEAVGWYSTERSSITTASQYGIGTPPADFFSLVMSADTTISPGSAQAVIAGTPVSSWTSKGPDENEIIITFSQPALVHRRPPARNFLGKNPLDAISPATFGSRGFWPPDQAPYSFIKIEESVPLREARIFWVE